MGFLQGKRILITGIASPRSIAYGIAKACHREGAELAFTYAMDRFKDRITSIAKDFGSDLVYQMDVSKDEEIAAVADQLKERWGYVDGIVHSIAFAPREAICGDFLDGCSREAFRTAMEISAYSFPARAKAFRPLMKGRQASLLTMTYLGAERIVPNYNTMGPCKAALESATRFMAESLGADGIRVNAISAGPIRTLAAAGIKDFQVLLSIMEKAAPLRRTVTIEEVGNTAAFLLSDMASGITADTIYVDAGFHSVAVGTELPAAS